MRREISVGERFGRLIVMYRVPQSHSEIMIHCKCDCGNEVDVRKYSLLNGSTKSCGCLRKEKTRKLHSKDLTGKRFGKLLVLKKVGTSNNQQKWLCKCDCGNMVETYTSYLTTGDTKSCGCYKKERLVKHGYSKTKLYHVYLSMIQRCYNPKAQEYHCYGGRGICVCDEWKDDFLKFRQWAIDNGYEENKGLTIERVNNDSGYEPSNCQWATRKEQAQNRSTNHYLEKNGEIHTVSQWAKILQISITTVYKRLKSGDFCEV